MAKARKRGRPNSADTLGMMLKNLFVSMVTLWFAFKLFGPNIIIVPRLLQDAPDTETIQKLTFWMLLPGAAIGFSGLWNWLIRASRDRMVGWGSACLYGIGIAFANLPVCGVLIGLLLGDPFLAFLLALLSLLMIPSVALAMIFFGLIMGAYNAHEAQNWIEKRRPADS